MRVVVGLIGAVVFGLAFLVGGTVAGYPVVRALGVSELEGKAGYYAFFFVGVPLGVLGAVVAFRLASHFQSVL